MGNDAVPQLDDSSLDSRLETHRNIGNNMPSQRDEAAPAGENYTRENVHETNMNRASSIAESLILTAAAGQSLDSQSSSNQTGQSPRLQIEITSSSDNNNNSLGNESGTTSSSSATATQLGRHVHFGPSSVGMTPAQEAHLPPIATQSTALTQLRQAQTQAGAVQSHESLINQLSSIRSPSSLAQIQMISRDMQQALSSTTALAASPLNQLCSVPVLSPSSLAGLSPNSIAQLQELTSLSSLNASLIGHFELTSLAQTVARLHDISQAQVQAQAVPSLQQSLLDLAAAQANQSSSLPPSQPTTELINAYLRQNERFAASLNPPIPPFPPQAQDQYHRQLIHRLIQDNAAKDQIIALLLSRQQAGAPNNENTSAQTASSPDLLELQLLLRSIHTNPASNPSHTSHGFRSQVAVPAPSAPPISQQSPLLTSNSVIFSGRCHGANPVSSMHAFAPDKPSDPKDIRWMARYEELKQFQQKHGHCRVPHGYVKNRQLSWWVMNQRAQYHLSKQGKKSWLSADRINLLNAVGFDWKPIVANPTNSK